MFLWNVEINDVHNTSSARTNKFAQYILRCEILRNRIYSYDTKEQTEKFREISGYLNIDTYLIIKMNMLYSY